MLGRFSLKIYLLNGFFLKSLRRAGILTAELKCGFFDTSCHGICKRAPKSTVGKHFGCTFYYNALRSWLIKVGIKSYLYNICHCIPFLCGISPHFVRSGDIPLFIYLYATKCSHVVSSSKREDPGNEKAVCLSPKKLPPVCFAVIICFIFVKCPWLV